MALKKKIALLFCTGSWVDRRVNPLVELPLEIFSDKLENPAGQHALRDISPGTQQGLVEDEAVWGQRNQDPILALLF